METIVVHLPLRPNRRAGRKYLIAPNGATTPAESETPQLQTMQKALVRAHLGGGEIEPGKYDGVRDFARREKINEDYVSRQISLTLLAPAVVEAILENKQPKYLRLQSLYEIAPLAWDEQSRKAGVYAETGE
jgi:hypothetical protein